LKLAPTCGRKFFFDSTVPDGMTLAPTSGVPSVVTRRPLKPAVTVSASVTAQSSDSQYWLVVVLNLYCHCVANGLLRKAYGDGNDVAEATA
jgi:hypothetical protein